MRRVGGHYSSPVPDQAREEAGTSSGRSPCAPNKRGTDWHPGRGKTGAPAHSLVLLLTSRARAMPSSMKATTFWKSSSRKWREVSAGAPGGQSPSGPGAAQGHQPQKPIPPRGSPSPSPHGVLCPSLSQKLAPNSDVESSERVKQREDALG